MLSRIGMSTVCLLFLAMGGCGLGPDPKLESYVTIPAEPPVHSFLDRYSSNDRLPIGLLVLNDTTEKDSAPPLSEESISSLAQEVTRQIERQHPVHVVQVIQNPRMNTGSPEQFSSLGKEAGVDFLLVTILSSQEIETPDRLPLQGINQGGGRGWLVGYRAENFSLAEVAFVEVGTHQSLFQANGQGFATLDRLAVPLESNVYPVVRGARRQPPIYPEEQHAHDVLRAVSARNAIDQALFHLKIPHAQPSMS